MKTQTKQSLHSEDKLFNFRPVFFAAVFLCLGIVFAYYRAKGTLSAWWLTLWLPMLVAPFCFCRTRKQIKARAFALCLLVFSFCVGHSAFFIKTERFTSGRVFQEEQTVLGTLIERQEVQYGTWAVLTDLSIGDLEEEGKLVAYLPTSFADEMTISDRIVLVGKVYTKTECFQDGVLDVYAIGDDIRFEMKNARGCTKAGETFDLFLSIRQRVQKVVYVGMDETPAAVTMAVLLGDTAGIENALLENIRMGGIAHIFAVSGLHVGALYAFCRLLMQKTRLGKMPKLLRWGLLFAILFFYAGVCGFSASVVRATVICLTTYAAYLIGTETDFLQSLGLSAIIVLLLSPTALFEVGFQLSFLACLGLALLSKPIEKALYELGRLAKKLYIRCFYGGVKARSNPPSANDDTPPLTVLQRMVRSVVSFLSACFAAQIFTAPVLMIAFEYVSGWGLLLNCLFVPLISCAFAVLLLFVLAACLLPASLVAAWLYVPSVVWSVILLTFETVDFSSFMLSGFSLSGGSILSYYGGWQFLSDKWNVTNRQKWTLAMVCFLAFAITMYALNV
ncbi:MAG: ComEC/Rec2 family competence protein [Clostridia bacterium]|nr:ComEC/Rec2 family competence protein [Clostridia bacterium]